MQTIYNILSARPLYYIYIYIIHYRRKFRSQTSDNMDRWKAEQGRGREKRKIRRERVRRQKMQMRQKVGKSRNTVFFQWFVAPEGRKVGSLKRRVRSQLARWEMKKCTPLWREAHFEVKRYKTPQRRTTFGSWDVEKVHAVVARSTFPSQNVQNTPLSDVGPPLEVAMSKKCTPLWREAHFQVKMYKTHHARTTFGSWDVEKVHAVVARSTFPSQNVQNTPCSDHFWRFRCRKSARRCGAKHISKSKCTKHTSSEPLLEVQMSKKCTPLWREAHFQVKMYTKHTSSEPLLEVKMSKKCTPLWREAHFQVKMYTKHTSSEPLLEVKMSKKCATLHYLPLHFTTLHYTPLH